MLQKVKENGLSGAALKWIAIVTMFIDHVAHAVVYLGYMRTNGFVRGDMAYNIYSVMRIIGRLAFPIFCFLITEGWFHTRNKAKYGIRLALFGLISEIPFDLAFSGKLFDWGSQNVFFTLALGLLAIAAWENIAGEKTDRKWWKTAAAAVAVLGIAVCAELAETDYGWFGVLLIFDFYVFRGRLFAMFAGTLALITVSQFFGMSETEFFALAACAPILMYNGERGKQNKYFFYVFYPAHLMILHGIRLAIFV